MTAYNFAQGGDPHYNPNYALYPQNALVTGRPEYGSSKTLLKPAHHWEGGHYAPVRHLSFADEQHQIGLMEASQNLAEGDTFLTHIIPSMSLLTDFHYVIHTPVDGIEFTVRTAVDNTVLGTIDASVAGDGWMQVTSTSSGSTGGTQDDGGSTGGSFSDTVATGLYVPSLGNDGIEFVIDSWVAPNTTNAQPDPCGLFPDCEPPIPLCMTLTAFYKHARAEMYCEQFCYTT